MEEPSPSRKRAHERATGTPASDPPDGGGASCLEYETAEERLVLDVGDERREIRLRPQGHRLTRYMAARNVMSGGSPALCTHDELIQAVWEGDPLHTRGELAKLVWEIRKALEPYGAASLLESEPRRGYRLHTCPATSAPASTGREPASEPSADPGDGSPPRATRLSRARARALIALGVAVAVAVLVAASTVVLRSHDGRTPGEDPAETRAFVDRIENILEQSSGGRQEVANTLIAGLDCLLAPAVAAGRLSSAAENRQSILDQIASLRAPDAETARATSLLQKALQESIEADRHYRDGFAGARPTACPPATGRDFVLARASDARATAAKQRFVLVFDPLARRFDRRTWVAGEF